MFFFLHYKQSLFAMSLATVHFQQVFWLQPHRTAALYHWLSNLTDKQTNKILTSQSNPTLFTQQSWVFFLFSSRNSSDAHRFWSPDPQLRYTCIKARYRPEFSRCAHQQYHLFFSFRPWLCSWPSAAALKIHSNGSIKKRPLQHQKTTKTL